MLRVLRPVPILLSAVLVAGCGNADRSTAVPARGAASTPASSGAITVFAAASLTTVISDRSRAYQAAHPGIRIRLNFGGSSALAAAIVEGAPADVFLAASAATMATVTDSGEAVGAPVALARNRLEMATAPGNPRRINRLSDVARPGVTLALCAPQVPCGAAAVTAFRDAGLRATPVTLESDVKAVLTKVRLGEVDVGLVYRTDVLAAAGQVTGVPFPEAAQAPTAYSGAVLRASGNRVLAADFLSSLRSVPAVAALRRAGFLPP